MFITRLIEGGFTVFAPQEKTPVAQLAQETDYVYKKLALGDSWQFSPYRAVEPVKSFLNYIKEDVAGYFAADKVSEPEQCIVFGLKNCDITSLALQDYVFLEGVCVDSVYRLRREKTFFVSSDCTGFKSVCFCMALDILPYATQGFDLNFSALNDGYVVEVASKRAAELIGRYPDYFLPAKEEQLSSRLAKSEALVEKLKRHLLPQDIPPRNSLQRLVKEGYELDTWKEFMRTCVECGGCNLICPDCHCFLLADADKTGPINEKLRVWDSCQYANFARVAGGANPLKSRTQRFRNRFMKKFDFFFDNLGIPGCTGCGRCIEVCPGKIDLREVLKDLRKRLAA